MQVAESFMNIIDSLEIIVPNIMPDYVVLVQIYETKYLHVIGKRRVLFFIFMLGDLVTAASGVRLYCIYCQTQFTTLGSAIDVTSECTNRPL